MENKDNVITAHLGVFSGRENPAIVLEGDTQKQFSELVQAVVGKEPTHPAGSVKLGDFYGFLIQIPSSLAKKLSLPQTMEVRNGVVSVLQKKETTHWRDIIGLENFLITQAGEQGHQDILDMLGVKPEYREVQTAA